MYVDACRLLDNQTSRLQTNLIGAWHAIGATLQGGPDEDLLAHP